MSISSISSVTSQYAGNYSAARAKSGPAKGFDSMISNFIKGADSDGDGSLSSSELSSLGLSQDAFKSLDTNGDAKLSADEIKTAAKKQMDAMRSAFEANASTSGATSQTVGDLQNTPEGQLMQAMRPQGPPPPPPPGGSDPAKSLDSMVSNFIKGTDSNGDGILSSKETSALGISQDAFTALDTNGDGQLSSDEISAAVKKQMDAVRSAFESGGLGSISQTIQDLQSTPEGELMSAMKSVGARQSAASVYDQGKALLAGILGNSQVYASASGAATALNVTG